MAQDSYSQAMESMLQNLRKEKTDFTQNGHIQAEDSAQENIIGNMPEKENLTSSVQQNDSASQTANTAAYDGSTGFYVALALLFIGFVAWLFLKKNRDSQIHDA